MAEVTKKLASVSRMVRIGHRIIFDSPDIGSFIENKKTGKDMKLRQHNGIYLLDMWVAPNPSKSSKMDFTGPVK